MQDVEIFSGIRLGPGTLYGSITRLEERGWVAPVGAKDRRQPYTITEAGRAHLKRMLDGLYRVVNTGLTRLVPPPPQIDVAA
jgi:DNA-binding PadR family transcriptional regulator